MLQVLDWGTYGRNHYYFALRSRLQTLRLDVKLPPVGAVVDIYPSDGIDTGYHLDRAVEVTVSTGRQEACFTTHGLIVNFNQEGTGTVCGCIYQSSGSQGDLTNFTILDENGKFFPDCPGDIPLTFN